MTGFNVWQFIAAIAVFVYAMFLIEQSIRQLAGRSFKKFLQRASGSKWLMMGASTVATAVLQSSSVLLLMVLSFVGAGLLSLQGALAAALGSNLGSTCINWFVALVGFKIDFHTLAFPLLALALPGLLFFRKNKTVTQLTLFLIGLALLFISLHWLKSGLDSSLESYLAQFTSWHYLLFIPIGFIITAIVQTSSATVAITLSMLYNNLIPFESAAAIVAGSEVGTSLKFLLGAVGGNVDKQRVAWGNFYLNSATVLIAAILMIPLIDFIRDWLGIQEPLTALVAFQTALNILCIIIFFPLIGVFATWLEQFFSKNNTDHIAEHIRIKTAALPGDALDLATEESIHLLRDTLTSNKVILGEADEEAPTSLFVKLKNLTGSGPSTEELYEQVKILHGEILEYITEIPKEGMTEAEVEKTGKLININRHILRSAKNMKDIRHNIEEFEASANDDLHAIFQSMKDRTLEFYREFTDFISEPAMPGLPKITTLLRDNRKQYDANISLLITAIRDNKISELDSSSLLNVNREIYSSNKGLIRSLADLSEIDSEDEPGE